MSYATLIDLLRTTEALRGGGLARDEALRRAGDAIRYARGLDGSDSHLRDACAYILLALEANHAAR